MVYGSAKPRHLSRFWTLTQINLVLTYMTKKEYSIFSKIICKGGVNGIHGIIKCSVGNWKDWEPRYYNGPILFHEVHQSRREKNYHNVKCIFMAKQRYTVIVSSMAKQLSNMGNLVCVDCVRCILCEQTRDDVLDIVSDHTAKCRKIGISAVMSFSAKINRANKVWSY